jgi:multidrug transporter EmrE-like cation transporter
MSSFAVGNVFLVGSMLCNVGSQFLMKKVLDEVRDDQSSASLLQQVLVSDRLLRGGAGMALLVVGFALWILCLARLELAYAYTIASSSVVFVTFFSAIFLSEVVTARMWLGTVLVLVGIVLVGPSR